MDWFGYIAERTKAIPTESRREWAWTPFFFWNFSTRKWNESGCLRAFYHSYLFFTSYPDSRETESNRDSLSHFSVQEASYSSMSPPRSVELSLDVCSPLLSSPLFSYSPTPLTDTLQLHVYLLYLFFFFVPLSEYVFFIHFFSFLAIDFIYKIISTILYSAFIKYCLMPSSPLQERVALEQQRNVEAAETLRRTASAQYLASSAIYF